MRTTFRIQLTLVWLSGLLVFAPGRSRCHADPPAQAAAAAFDARYVRMEVPAKLLTDQVFLAKITMKNTGSQAWGDGMKLRSQDPPDNTNWGTSFIIMGQGRSAKPGEEFTFTSYLKAPAAAGKFAFQWRVAKIKDNEMFGQPTARKFLVVDKRPAEPAPKPPAQDPSGKHVLTFEDFEYAGSFKVPGSVAGRESEWSQSGLALRKMPDGTKRLFMNYGVLFEAEIPPLVKLRDGHHAPLKVAEAKKVWGAVKLAKPGEQAISANAEFWWDDSKKLLYWSSYHAYWTERPWPLLAASKLEDDGKGQPAAIQRGGNPKVTHFGPWRVPKSVRHYKSYWGGVTKLPKAFADQYTGGRALALGFGGYYSICGPASQGPALCAIAEPDPAKPTLDAIELLVHPWGQDSPAPRDGDYFVANCSWGGQQPRSPRKGSWTMDDFVRTGVFLDLPDKHAFVAFAYLGTGRMGYDYGHIRSAGAADWWYFYDPKDLGAAAKGAKGARKPWEVLPHSRTKVNYPPAAREPKKTPPAPVYGSCFDAEDRLLYLFKRFWVDNKYPCIHVYRVK